MMRWTNGLPDATTRLGAKMALRGLAASQPGCARIPMMVRSKRCSTKRPDTLMQLSRSSLSEIRLAPRGRAIHLAHRDGTLPRANRAAIGADIPQGSRAHRCDANDPMYGPAVHCKKTSTSWRMCGLASMYPAFEWSLSCSGPSWISARVRPHYRKGLMGHLGHQCSHAPGRPILHLVSHPLADLGR